LAPKAFEIFCALMTGGKDRCLRRIFIEVIRKGAIGFGRTGLGRTALGRTG
jgi:hypothetical protein